MEWSDFYLALGGTLMMIAVVLYEVGMMYFPTALVVGAAIVWLLACREMAKEEQRRERRELRELRRRRREWED